MNLNETLLAGLKDLNAMEILSLVAHAKTGDEHAITSAPEGALKDANETLEWFIEVLVNKSE